MDVIRPRRSMLFMPASNARALEKAKSLPCDGLIFDLEDAVAPDTKVMARSLACAAVAGRHYGNRECVIRINGLDTPWWRDDLAAAIPAKPHAILIPKVQDAAVLHRVEEELAWHGADAHMHLWAMIETPFAFLRAETLASASDRVNTWVIGTNDLVKDLHARHTRDRMPVATALGLALLVARAHGINILDGVYGDFKDDAGFAFECEQARDMGFDGKTLIHPNQIEIANRAFAPSVDEIDHAQRMIAAFDLAASEGKGVAVLDGRMVEELHVVEARRKVAMANAIAALQH